MKINLSKFLESKDAVLEVDFEYDVKDLEEFKNHDVVYVESFHVAGRIVKKNDKLNIDLDFTGKATFKCNRCLEDTQKSINGKINTDILIGGINEDIDDILDLSDIVEEAIILSLPVKVLCQENCKGLCSRCGKNLNFEECNCKEDEIDPRFEKLKTFFQGNKEV